MRINGLHFLGCLLFCHFTASSLAQNPWIVHESSHFRVFFDASDRSNAIELMDLLQTGYEELQFKLQTQVSDTIQVFLCPNEKSFDTLTGKMVPHWGEGVADPQNHVIVLKSPKFSKNYDRFPKLVLHELIHIFVGELNRQAIDIPRWFNEGIAIYLSKDPDFAGGQAISKALISNSILALDEIDDVLNFHKEKARLAYEESYSVFLFIEDKFGKEWIFELLGNLKQQPNFNQAFLQTFDMDLIDFEWEWMQFLEKKYRWSFLLDFETYLWIFILVTFILVFVAIKIRNRKVLKKWENQERWMNPHDDWS